MDEKRRRISMTVSIKLLHFFLSSPPLSTPPVDRREELCSERSRLTSVASPPPSNEICDRAEPRHLQLLSSSLYLPRFVLLPARLPTATAGPGLINISESR